MVAKPATAIKQYIALLRGVNSKKFFKKGLLLSQALDRIKAPIAIKAQTLAILVL
jgi:hypothetical protein